MTGTQINIGRTSTGRPVGIHPRYAARHGLIAGATGTGKSYTIARLVEQFTAARVPVFLVDVKGDLSGIARTVPSQFFAPAGQTGARFAIRADDMGADCMARALQLTDAQAAALESLYAWAADKRRPIGGLRDLRHAIDGFERIARTGRYGHVSRASLGVVRRAIMRLGREPCQIFGSSSFDVLALDKPGCATILDATRLYHCPAQYGAAVLYMLQALYARLPEIGDTGAPRLVVILDEAHLIFSELAPALLQRVERIIRLIRSKGVAIYFASQSPADIPAAILGQLGNRVQHGLRGATLVDLRAIRAAADTMPINPAIDAAAAITSLGVGQALVSTIGADGCPAPVEIVKVAAPSVPLSPIDEATRARLSPAAPWAAVRAEAGRTIPRSVSWAVMALIAAPIVVAAALAILQPY